MLKKLLATVLILLLVSGAVALFLNLRTPPDLYSEKGVFAGCPTWPNCVSSIATDDEHRVPAFGFASDPSTAYAMLQEVVDRMGGRVEHQSPGYLHAVFLSPKLHLRDDLELLVLPEGRVEVRSASRFDYRKSGINRSRVEELRRSFEAQP